MSSLTNKVERAIFPSEADMKDCIDRCAAIFVLFGLFACGSILKMADQCSAGLGKCTRHFTRHQPGSIR